MNEPKTKTVTLSGDDVELQVIGACVQLIEAEYNIDENGCEDLDAAAKARVAIYLAKRFAP